MANITLNHIYKNYSDDVIAVNDFDLKIEDQEFLVLVGPSGCGKSTTLRMIAGLEAISEGELYIGDRLVNQVSPKDRDIAMVFQSYALYPHMSCYENMAFALKLNKIKKEEIKQRVINAAKLLDIEHLLNRKPKELSGGQRQRIALGRAIVREPQVFLMDEPLSNLDAKLRVQMRAEISKLHKRLETTIVYVTHDQTEALTMGDRIVVMKDGIIQQVDTPHGIYHSPHNKFVASFIGSPSMNFLQGSLIEEQKELFFVTNETKIKIPLGQAEKLRQKVNIGSEIEIGIRPENIHDELAFIEAVPDEPFTVEVEMVENLGSEIYLYVKGLNNQTLIIRVNARTLYKIGDTIPLAFDMNKAHFFDPQTEQRMI